MGVGMLVASAVSGALSRCVVHPLDTLRARLMVASSKETAGLVSVARGIIAKDGVRGLYRGFGVSVVMQAPAVATYLTSYERAKAGLPDATGMSPRNPGIHLGSAMIAETISAVFWVPMEVIKQRAQVRTGAAALTSSFTVATDLLRHEGPRALFKGYALTIGVFGPYSMVYFVCYERLKERWAKHFNVLEKDLPLYAVATSASCSGAVAGAVTCPLDIIKTRMQTQDDVVRKGSSVQYRSTWHAAQSIAQQEGARGFMRGISARVLWIMPGSAITMTCFEFLKNKFLVPADSPKTTDV